MSRIPAVVKEAAGDKSLKEYLEPYEFGEKMFLAALARGYSSQEAHNIVKKFGINITQSLLKPGVQDAVEVLGNNVWYAPKEAHDYWMEMLGGYYEELAVMRGIGELMVENAMERDNLLVKEATRLVTARMTMQRSTKKLDGPIGGNYDEMILRRHREIPNGQSAEKDGDT